MNSARQNKKKMQKNAFKKQLYFDFHFNEVNKYSK